ncbi:MAG: taurine catabolism dioxygenase TauD, partial [Gammaproteobacteria bacterium]|nr:taurine catabolism dioxygenase TauD [Gammaproteobacteria bacterium]
MQNLSPFDLGNDSAYSRWRDQKLEQAPTKLEELVVEIDDPRTL